MIQGVQNLEVKQGCLKEWKRIKTLKTEGVKKSEGGKTEWENRGVNNVGVVKKTLG